MKIYKISLLTLGAALFMTACNDMDEQIYEGGTLTTDQVTETNMAVPSRVDASFAGMYNMMAEAHSVFPTATVPTTSQQTTVTTGSARPASILTATPTTLTPTSATPFLIVRLVLPTV